MTEVCVMYIPKHTYTYTVVVYWEYILTFYYTGATYIHYMGL